ncbi:MAG: chemotaxis protein CheX [Halanaerobiales bacterium]
MNLSEKIIESCNNTFPMFGYELEYLSENTERNLNSTEDVNILIGLSNSVQGNVVISFKMETALNIISAMMGGMEVIEIDDMGKSALGEMANMVMGSAISGLSQDGVIDLSPPTIAIGKDTYIMISNIEANKMHFILADHSMYVAYALQ